MQRIAAGESPIGSELINIHSWMRAGKARKSDIDRIKEGYNAKIDLESDPAKIRKLERELRYRVKQLREQAIKDLSSVSRCKRITKTAEALIEVGGADRFWLGWFVDKRRRHYALGPISPIEREVSKALLLMGTRWCLRHHRWSNRPGTICSGNWRRTGEPRPTWEPRATS